MYECILSPCVSAPQARGTCRALSTLDLMWRMACGCWEPSPRPSSVGATSAPTADPLF